MARGESIHPYTTSNIETEGLLCRFMVIDFRSKVGEEDNLEDTKH